MSSKKKNRSRVVNVRDIFHADIEIGRDGFVLVLFTGSGEAPTKTRLHFESWWVPYLGTLLWTALRRYRKDLEGAEKALRGE